MRKTIIMLAAILTGISAAAMNCGNNGAIRFSELPFAEGTLYVSVSCGDEQILQSASEVESDTISFPVDMSKLDGKEIEVKAFQDLNDNKTLDFDSYGRPHEPCLQTKVTVDSANNELDFKLVQY